MEARVKVIVGKLGSGKTWRAVCQIIDALLANEVVVTNIVLDWTAVELFVAPAKIPRGNYRFLSSEEFDENPQRLLDILPPTGATLVLDEVHLFLNARKWKENMAKGQTFLDFITQARKVRVDCLFISQDERNVDAQLVRMATHIIRLVNWQDLPLLGKLLPLRLTVARICQPDGVTAVGREWIWRIGGIGKCYQTTQTFRNIELKGEAAAKVIGGKRKHVTYGAYLIVAGVICLGWDQAAKYRVRKKAAEKAEIQARAEAEREGRKGVGVGKVAPGLSGPPPTAQQALQRTEKGLSAQERVMIECDLPPVYKVNPTYISLMGGELIAHGSFFLSGIVKGWKLEGGTVLVNIESDELQQVRLFYGTRPRPFLYNHDGGVVRRPAWNHRSVSAPVASGNRFMAQSGDGSSGVEEPQAPAAAAPYQRPEAFIPGKSEENPQLEFPAGKEARPIDFLSPSTRLDKPRVAAKPHH